MICEQDDCCWWREAGWAYSPETVTVVVSFMELAKPNGSWKLLDSPEDDGREQEAGSIGAKEVIGGATTAVIVEKKCLARKKPKVLGHKHGSPRGRGTRGFTAEKEELLIKTHRMVELGTHPVGDQVGLSRLTLEQSRQIETVEQVADDGGSVHLENFQGRALWQSRQGKRRHGNLTARRAIARGLL